MIKQSFLRCENAVGMLYSLYHIQTGSLSTILRDIYLQFLIPRLFGLIFIKRPQRKKSEDLTITIELLMLMSPTCNIKGPAEDDEYRVRGRGKGRALSR